MESKIEGLGAGADDYVTKPVHAQELAARVRALLVRFGHADQPSQIGRAAPGRLHAYYGAKGGVGTTTLAINSAIALHRDTKRSVVLVDGNLQFGDHRVFLDMSADKHSIVDAVTATDIDADVVRRVVVRHKSGVDPGARAGNSRSGRAGQRRAAPPAQGGRGPAPAVRPRRHRPRSAAR